MPAQVIAMHTRIAAVVEIKEFSRSAIRQNVRQMQSRCGKTIIPRMTAISPPSCADDPQTDGAYIVRELPAGDGYELLVWCVAGRQITSGCFVIHFAVASK
jgi:hypothetical protein